MNKFAKGSNRLFLSLVLTHIVVAVILELLEMKNIASSMTTRIILSELTIVVPALIYSLIGNLDLKEWIPVRRLKFGDLILIILFTYAMMPFITVINLVSQLFVENAVTTNMFEEAMNLPVFASIFYMGILGPLCEELVFRGFIYQGYRKSGNIFGGMLLSGLLFGLLHLNFNQFCYATVLGAIFVMLYEATGNFWAPFIGHMVINTHNTLLMIETKKAYERLGLDITQAINVEVSTTEKLLMIAIFMAFGTAFTLLAAFLFMLILKRNNTNGHIKNIFITISEQIKIAIVSPACIIGVILCILYMTGLLGRFIDTYIIKLSV